MALSATGGSDTLHRVGRKGFFAARLAVMQPGTLAPVDLYIRVKNPPRFVLYKSAGATLTDEVRHRLIDNNVHELYIQKADEEAYGQYVERNISTIIRDDLLPLEDACTLVYDNSRRVMAQVFESPQSTRNLRRVRMMSEAMVLGVLRDSDAIWHMTSLASRHYRTYTHSVNVALYMVAAANEVLGIDDARTLTDISYGSVLHDIGKTEIPTRILDRPGALSDEEFEIVRHHPVAGLRIVSRYGGVPRTAASIIRSHHENVGGTGYPEALEWESIPPVARLARIVDAFEAMTTDRPHARARTPYAALHEMASLGRVFDVALLRCFIVFLGPRPPKTDQSPPPQA